MTNGAQAHAEAQIKGRTPLSPCQLSLDFTQPEQLSTGRPTLLQLRSRNVRTEENATRFSERDRAERERPNLALAHASCGGGYIKRLVFSNPVKGVKRVAVYQSIPVNHTLNLE